MCRQRSALHCVSGMKVFIAGGSGYLGLFLLEKLSDAHHDVAFSYHSRALTAEELKLVGNPKAFRIDLTSGAGFDAVSEEFGCVRFSEAREAYA